MGFAVLPGWLFVISFIVCSWDEYKDIDGLQVEFDIWAPSNNFSLINSYRERALSSSPSTELTHVHSPESKSTLDRDRGSTDVPNAGTSVGMVSISICVK